MQRSRAGSALGRALSPEPALDGRPSSAASHSTAAAAGSTTARSRLQSVSSMTDKRRSVVLVAPTDGEPPGSTSPPAGTSTGHPGLTRLSSLMRKKSLHRGRMAGIHELSAAMDNLDDRILAALEQMRQQNAAGLGHIRALHRTKSGKLMPNSRGPAREDAIPAFSPRAVLGAAVDDPAVLQRLKFHADEQQGLHDGGVSSARGRLEGELVAAAAEEASPADDTDDRQIDDMGSPESKSPSASPPLAGSLGAADKKRHTIAVPAQGYGSPKWGSTEGGRDTLGWVRSLVKFTEAQPFMDATGAKAEDMPALAAAAAGAEGTGGPTGAVSRPSRREDVLQLQSWLQEMMVQTLAQVGTRPLDTTDGANTDAMATVADKAPSELADAALWVYGVAFEELQRQVATESKDRGDLLSAMWEHCFNLVELRCSLTYEEVIAGIKQELQSARRHRQQLQAQVKTLEGTVSESMYYDKTRFLEMESEKKRLARLLAAAEEEGEATEAELERLKKALAGESALRAELEAALHEADTQKDALEQRVGELTQEVAQQAGTISSHAADIMQLRDDLAHSRAQERQLAEEKAKLEVDLRRAQRDFQSSEILGMSLKEQLQARGAELAQLKGEHEDLLQRHAATQAELADATSAVAACERDLDVLHRSSAETKSELQGVIARLEASLRDSHSQLAALQLEKQGVDNALKESTARESVFSSQLRQLTAAHEQQAGSLRREVELRKGFEDEVQALRAGLQVTQQKLEGMGLVFASNMVHHTAAQAWLATGPLSMGRQVVTVLNQQLSELVAKQQSLQHELAVAKEHWQSEEGVRIKLQEQLLDVKSQLSKMTKDKEAGDTLAARLEQQRNTLDNEVTQMRKMVSDAESRAQAAHKKSLEAVSETKRLQPLEGRVAKLEEQLQGSKADVHRLQQEVASHQATICKLLDEKAAALEELSRRTQALDAATAEIRQLNAAVRDREQLQASTTQLQSDLQEHLRRQSAQDSVLKESMQQLAVARQLLQEFSGGQERDRLRAAEAEAQKLQQGLVAKSREVELLQQRLASTEQQLQYTERQLGVLVAASPSTLSTPAGSGQGSAPAGQQLGAIVEQLRRVLEVKEVRIRQLERAHGSASASASQLKQLQADIVGRDGEISKLRKELEGIRKKLHAVQEERLKVATRDLITMAAETQLPQEHVKEMLHQYVHDHLRSEVVWSKAKLAVVSHLAKKLRAKLRAEQVARAQAEMESICVETFYLHQAILDQRAAAALFDSTFVEVKQTLVAAVQAVAEAQQLIGPQRADLVEVQRQLRAVAAALHYWLDKLDGRVDKGMQADRPELDSWQQLVQELPATRPGAGSPQLADPAAASIVRVYAHRLESMLVDGAEPRASDTVFDAIADYYVERQGHSRTEVCSSCGPVAALLAAARSHLHKPKQLLLGMLAGLAPTATGSVHPEGAWGFLLRLLHCMARLHGTSWQAFVQEWAEAEEGVGLPLQCVMDVLANIYNTDAPALLDCTRRSLVPLIRQGRRGPSIDADAFLLVMVNEFVGGHCPVDPLAMPRRLTDGSLANALNYHAAAPALPSLATVSGIAAAAGLVDPYAAAASPGSSPVAADSWRQKNPMRKRIVNLTVSTTAGGSDQSPPGAGLLGLAPGKGSAGSPGGSSSKPAAAPRSTDIFQQISQLAAINPGLPFGADSQLRRSAATNPPRT